MAIPLVPWEPHCFPEEIQAELRRRSVNRGLRPINSGQVSWKGNDDEWTQYRGPMTAWVRVCSNGYGSEHADPSLDRSGFVLYGGKDFSTSYGFNKGVISTLGTFKTPPNVTILGYTPEGEPHIIENDVNSQFPIHVPNPEIEKLSATIQKELLRRVRIEWTCFSFKQLEYMTPYFLVPGISCTVEWGWNHYNMESLLDLTNTDKLSELYNDPYPLYTENILKSKGNYEILFGIVTNFEWSIDGNKIKCVTEVTSKDRLYAGMAIRNNIVEADPALSDDEKTTSTGKPKKPSSIPTLGVLDSLKKFVDQYIDKFKDVIDHSLTSEQIVDLYFNDNNKERRPLRGIIQYLKEMHPDNYKEYLFGLYYGRDEKTVKQSFNPGGFSGLQERPVKVLDDSYANKEHDWDGKGGRSHLWMNMGLVIEIINYYASQLKSVKNKPMFRVDVDDTIITGHPNLISTDWKILLIPNAMAPKYFTGLFGAGLYGGDVKYEQEMAPADIIVPLPEAPKLDPEKIAPSLDWANYRLRQLFNPFRSGIRRDDLSSLINANRIEFVDEENTKTIHGDYEFPFPADFFVEEGNDLRKYQAYYTGLFRNLYFNVKEFKKILKDDNVIYFSDVIKRIFSSLNSAAGEFWKFKLDGGAGRVNSKGYAAMKIVDENLTQYTSNVGNVFTFDYYAADGLLNAINFRPTLSNAQAIRTIYAQTNLTNKQKTVQSGYNELLDYKFKDRLFKIGNQSGNQEERDFFFESSWRDSMAKIQAVQPPDGALQVTTKNSKGQKAIYRLTIPSGHEDILGLMLDDNDKGHNPRYTGIMPGIQAEFTIQGIAGIRTFAVFRVRGLPEPYSEKNIVFRVINCNDIIQNGQWMTTIVAGVIPLRGYFASKLGLNPKIDVAKPM